MISAINVLRGTRGSPHPSVLVGSFSTRADAEAFIREAERDNSDGFYSLQTVVDVDAIRKGQPKPAKGE
jgi:hypothetical protein